MLNTINLLYTTAINFAQDSLQHVGKKPLQEGETAPLTGDTPSDKQTYSLAYNYARELLLDSQEDDSLPKYYVKHIPSADGGLLVKYGFGTFNWKTLEYEFPLDESDIDMYIVKQNKGEILEKNVIAEESLL